MNSVLSFACFFLSWAVCIFCAGNALSEIGYAVQDKPFDISPSLLDALPLAGPGIVAVLVVLQSFWMRDAARTIRLAVVVALLGTMLDSTLINLGVYWVAAPMGMSWICPLWITAMWVAVGVSLHGWLNFLQGRLAPKIAVGALGSLAVYFLANRFGAIGIDIPGVAAAFLFALLGALTLPLLLWVSNFPVYQIRNPIGADVQDTSPDSK